MIEKQKTCCICESHFVGFGNNPEPFDGEIGMCCESCDERFVVPVRIIWGRSSGYAAPLDALKRVAEVGSAIAYLNQTAREASTSGEVDESQDV